jgi:hypothetical protein
MNLELQHEIDVDDPANAHLRSDAATLTKVTHALSTVRKTYNDSEIGSTSMGSPLSHYLYIDQNFHPHSIPTHLQKLPNCASDMFCPLCAGPARIFLQLFLEYLPMHANKETVGI